MVSRRGAFADGRLYRTPQDILSHRRNFERVHHRRGALRAGVNRQPPPGLVNCAKKAAAEQIRERLILQSADDLPTVPTQRGEHLDQMVGAEVIDVLDRIVQDQRRPLGSSTSKVNGQEKGEAGRAALSAADDELRVKVLVDVEAQEAADVAPDAVFDATAVRMRPETLVELVEQRADQGEPLVDNLARRAFRSSRVTSLR